MKARLLHESEGLKRYVLVFSTGDSINDAILHFAQEHGIKSAQLSGIGGFSKVILGYFDWSTKQYNPIPVHEQVELVALNGNVTRYEGKPRLHAHAVIGKSDGSAWAGHLLEGIIRPTAEIFLIETSTTLRRAMDRESGLPLIDPAL
jgi:predicted DNA-binding protein with PD1-like motif